MIIENAEGPSTFTTDPSRHKIMEATVSLPPNAHSVSALPNQATARLLAESYFVNVSAP